jgi:hypothetical protein
MLSVEVSNWIVIKRLFFLAVGIAIALDEAWKIQQEAVAVAHSGPDR